MRPRSWNHGRRTVFSSSTRHIFATPEHTKSYPHQTKREKLLDILQEAIDLLEQDEDYS